MNQSTPLNRRHFLLGSVATTAAATLSSALHAQGSDVLKIGLVGCGGRGTGAATNALKADANVRLIAIGDAFGDRGEQCLAQLRRDNAIAAKIDVPAERVFTGIDAYRQVIASGVDVVLLCTPPGFRPLHIQAAVAADKHIFAEKPCAVDGPGVRAVLAACEEARRKRLAVVSGLCWRYHNGMRETFKRIHDGLIGDIHTMQCNYLTGTLWHRERTAQMSDMEWQIRNWLYFTWLSGDFNVEQHVHSLDKMAWAMRGYPVRAYGLGGRQVRTGPEFGHIFDHMSTVYEFENGAKCFSHCRQQAGILNEVKDFVWGSKGKADVMLHRITGETEWRHPPAQLRGDDMYQQEHNELFASIRRGQPINDGDWMSKSALMGIMGRMACYTGQAITWEQALNSRQNLAPASYRMDQALPVPEVARPGITRFS